MNVCDTRSSVKHGTEENFTAMVAHPSTELVRPQGVCKIIGLQFFCAEDFPELDAGYTKSKNTSCIGSFRNGSLVNVAVRRSVFAMI